MGRSRNVEKKGDDEIVIRRQNGVGMILELKLAYFQWHSNEGKGMIAQVGTGLILRSMEQPTNACDRDIGRVTVMVRKSSGLGEGWRGQVYGKPKGWQRKYRYGL
jgi:hypothetical protein